MQFTRLLVLAVLGPTLLLADEPPRRPVELLKQLGSNTLRHGAPVRALLWSPDGKRLYSSAQDGTVTRWDAASGAEEARFVGAVGTVRSLALTPDGKTLIAGGSDRNVRLFDATATSPGDGPAEVTARATLTPGGSAIETLAVHPGGERFFVGLEEGRWHAVATATARVQESGDVGDPVRCLAFLPEAELLLTNQDKGGFLLWRTVNPRRLHDFDGETLRCAALSPDGFRAVLGDFAGELRVVELPGGKVLWKKRAPAAAGQRAETTAVAFAPDGRSVVAAVAGGELIHCNAATGEEMGRFTGHRGRVYAVAFRGDGKELASAGDDGLIQRWEVATHKARGTGPAAARRVRSLSLSKSGKELATVVGGRVGLYDGRKVAPLRLPKGLAQREGVRAAVLLPAGDALLLQLADGSVVRTGRDAADLDPVLPASARGLDFAADGKTLAAITQDRTVLLVDLEGKREPLTLPLDGDLGKAIALAPGGKYVAAVATSSLIRVWETATGRLVHQVDGPIGGGLDVAFSPDTRLLYTAGRDRTVRVTEVATGLLRLELPIAPGYPTSVAPTADGRFLAVGTSTGTVVLFDAARGVILDQLDGHRGAVTTVAFHPETNALFSVANDGVLYQRDVAAVLKANRPQPLSLSKQQLEETWALLGTEDSRNVAVAVQTLLRAEKDALPLLRDRVHPIDATQVQRLLKEMDDDDFEVRDRSMRELGRMGRSVEGLLRAARDKPGLSVEVRVRVEELLDQLAKNRVSAEYLQSLRTVEVLERIGTAEARAALQKLAGGLANAELTKQAKAALERLKERR